LLGYWSRPWTEVAITEVVGSGPRAVRGPKHFLPDHEYQETEIAKRYISSGRQLSYLGDWHSHPGGGGSLSPADEQTLRRIIWEPAARCPVALMAVLAGGDPWELAVWSGELRPVLLIGTRLVLCRLETRSYDR
jgi:integrative and conjugative element protein (TIGR02256 family)